MIKMYINNEEVVSNKEFTISEEMLATPSTVLNNCYPALWENTKDYVSRFYFPKDYSKCIIGDGEFEKGSQRNIIKKVSGISPSFETNITKPWESLTIDGNSYQATSTDPVSPSPDYPSEIENVKGKNLLPNNAVSQTTNGVTFTVNDDKTILVNGNNDGTANSSFIIKYYSLKAGTYILNGCPSGGSSTTYRIAIQKTSDWSVLGLDTGSGSKQFTIDEATNVQVAIVIQKGQTISNLLFKPMIRLSSIIDDTYVPYGNIQIVETGKNLLDNKNPNYIAKATWQSTETGGKFSASTTWGWIGWNLKLNMDKQYTFSYGARNSKNIYLYIRTFTDATYTTIKTKIVTDGIQLQNTFKPDSEYVRIAFANNAVIEDIEIPNIQLEKGSTATSYESYTEEVVNIDLKGNELCSLPNGTKDELIVKNGRAKIIKRIGKVVLDGSEDWRRVDAVTSGNYYFYTDNVLSNILYDNNNRFIGLSNIGITSNAYREVEGVDTIYYDLRNRTRVYAETTKSMSLSEFKTWLSTHNTTVQYELETPEEIDLGEVTLPNTLIGQNNVTLDATLETNMEISYYYSSYDLLFAGVVKKTGNISLNPRYPHYADIQVLDFKTFLSEGETLNFVIDNKTIGQAIDMVIDAIKSYGFVKGNIMLDNIDEVIGAYSTDKKTAYDVFQYFSDITNSRWFTRMIDEDTVAIDFYDTDKLPVKPKIEYTEDWFCNNLIDDMSYSIKTDDYRNKQILLSDEVFGSTPYNDLLTSNGYDTSYTTTGKIASLTSAKIDGKDATFTTEANKEGGVEADIYYKPGEVGITTNNQIGAGKVIEITYIPLVEGREIIINDEEVNRIGSQLNRNGVISRYENRNDTTSSDELRQIGQTYIKYKGKAEVTLKITSRKNIYNIGDKVQFDAPLEDLSTEYMVKKKTTKYIVTANQLFYDYELSSSFNSESEINYFDNQRSKHKGNLSEGDYITRDIDITNSANIIWHDTSIDEISITGNNILDCPLDSPFTD